MLLRLEGHSMVEDLASAHDKCVLPVREYPDPVPLIAGIGRYRIEPGTENLRMLRPADLL